MKFKELRNVAYRKDIINISYSGSSLGTIYNGTYEGAGKYDELVVRGIATINKYDGNDIFHIETLILLSEEK